MRAPSKFDPYSILGVSPDSSDDEIKSAYRALARKHHPDLNPSPRAAERMKEINAAYAILGDPFKRVEYDHSDAWNFSGRDHEYPPPPRRQSYTPPPYYGDQFRQAQASSVARRVGYSARSVLWVFIIFSFILRTCQPMLSSSQRDTYVTPGIGQATLSSQDLELQQFLETMGHQRHSRARFAADFPP
jgi:hypothetical protein